MAKAGFPSVAIQVLAQSQVGASRPHMCGACSSSLGTSLYRMHLLFYSMGAEIARVCLCLIEVIKSFYLAAQRVH